MSWSERRMLCSNQKPFSTQLFSQNKNNTIEGNFDVMYVLMVLIMAVGSAIVTVLLLSCHKKTKIELKATQVRCRVSQAVNDAKKSSLGDFEATARHEAHLFAKAETPLISDYALYADIVDRHCQYCEDIALIEEKKIPDMVSQLGKDVNAIADFTQEIYCNIPQNLSKREKSSLKRMRRRAKNYLIDTQVMLDVIHDFQDKTSGPLAFCNWEIRSPAIAIKRDYVTALDLFCEVIRDKITLPNTDFRTRANSLSEHTEAVYAKVQALFKEKNQKEKELNELKKFIKEEQEVRVYLSKYISKIDTIMRLEE